jgi:hypothetical protein
MGLIGMKTPLKKWRLKRLRLNSEGDHRVLTIGHMPK